MQITFVTDARLQSKMGASRWLEYFDDDNDGVADASAVSEVLGDANADVQARLLGKGFTADRLQDLADEGDALLSRCAAEIAMGYAGERRPEFLDDEGFGPFEKLRQKAYRQLDMIAKAKLRIPSETEAGANTQVGGKLSKHQGDHGHFFFAPTAEDRAKGSRGPGGF